MDNAYFARIYQVLSFASVLWLILIGVAVLLANEYHYDIHSTDIKHESGCAYKWKLPEKPSFWPIMQFVDDSTRNNASTLTLYENRQSFGNPHSTHAEIKSKGSGRYSHWGKKLYFSGSDCSNPIENNRQYHVTIKPFLSNSAILIAILGILFLLTLIDRERNYQSILKTMLNSCDLSHKIALRNTLFLFVIIFSLGFLFLCWNLAKSVSLSAAGYFQVSDSFGYWLCSQALLEFGDFGPQTEWCERRAIYPSFLAGISWIAQKNIYAILIIQAFIVSLAIYLFSKRTTKLVGFYGAIISAVLICIYATETTYTLTMTENAGLAFGCIGLSLLLIAIEKRSYFYLVAGIAFFSIALNARAGAFFILPALILWSILTAKTFHKPIKNWLIATIFGISIGFAVQSFTVLAVGGSPTNSHGSFSYVLYGLSVGGKNWAQVIEDHPELFTGEGSPGDVQTIGDGSISRAIYKLAWQNLIAQPALIIQALSNNLSKFYEYGTYGFYRLGDLAILLQLGWWLAWIPIIINFKNPYYLLVGLCSLAILGSAAFLIGDAGPRVFAASIPVDVLHASIGFSWLSSFAVRGIKTSFIPQPYIIKHENASRAPSMDALFASFLIILLFIPHSPLRNIHISKFEGYDACSDDETTIVTQLGSGALLLDMTSSDNRLNFFKGQIRYKDFVERIPQYAWWFDSDFDFYGKSFLVTYQQDLTKPDAGHPYMIYTTQQLSQYHGHKLRLCASNNSIKTLFGHPYRKVNSIQKIE